MTKRRLYGALACYAALAGAGFIVLTDRRFFAAVAILLAGLAVMSFTAYLRERHQQEEEDGRDEDAG